MSDESVEREVREYEERNGVLPAHNKGVLRKMVQKDHDFWDTEEGRVLKDSNRYHDDV